jgi:hypothetical protein
MAGERRCFRHIFSRVGKGKVFHVHAIKAYVEVEL